MDRLFSDRKKAVALLEELAASDNPTQARQARAALAIQVPILDFVDQERRTGATPGEIAESLALSLTNGILGFACIVQGGDTLAPLLAEVIVHAINEKIHVIELIAEDEDTPRTMQ